MATEIQIAEIIAKLSAAFPNWKPTKYTVEVYCEDLSDIEPAELDAAVRKVRSEAGRAFAPSTGEIRGAVLELRKSIVGVPSSYQAWQEVVTQIRVNGGDFGRPVWSNQLVESAVQSIGWRELRMSENQVADRARFIAAYEQLADRAAKNEIELPQVRGYIEQAQANRAALEVKNLTKLLEAK